jgi:hypothetical protein
VELRDFAGERAELEKLVAHGRSLVSLLAVLAEFTHAAPKGFERARRVAARLLRVLRLRGVGLVF